MWRFYDTYSVRTNYLAEYEQTIRSTIQSEGIEYKQMYVRYSSSPWTSNLCTKIKYIFETQKTNVYYRYNTLISVNTRRQPS